MNSREKLHRRPPGAGRASEVPAGSIPSWVHPLGLAVWVVDPKRTIRFANPRAEALLRLPPERTIGRRCHEVIGALTRAGLPHCAPNCPLVRRARRGREIEPTRLIHRGPDGKERTIEIFLIADRPPGSREPWLVHCAREVTPEERAGEYVARLAARSPHDRAGREGTERPALSVRESRVLELLAEDETLHGIAFRLDVTYATVRNHVQHVLKKLGAHSIPEAVGQFLRGRA